MIPAQRPQTSTAWEHAQGMHSHAQVTMVCRRTFRSTVLTLLLLLALVARQTHGINGVKYESIVGSTGDAETRAQDESSQVRPPDRCQRTFCLTGRERSLALLTSACELDAQAEFVKVPLELVECSWRSLLLNEVAAVCRWCHCAAFARPAPFVIGKPETLLFQLSWVCHTPDTRSVSVCCFSQAQVEQMLLVTPQRVSP